MAKNLYEQLLECGTDTQVEIVGLLVGIDTVGPSFRNYLRETLAIDEPFTMGDAARAYLTGRMYAIAMRNW